MTERREARTQFSPAQRAGLEDRRRDQDRTLSAMHALESALGSAAPGRETDWRVAVIAALDVLGAAMSEEAENSDRPDSLLSDIALHQPRLRNRVRGLRLHSRQLRDAVRALRHELGEGEHDLVDFADVRQRLGSALAGLLHQRARESDLIYEAYYEAFRTDLRVDGGGTEMPARG